MDLDLLLPIAFLLIVLVLAAALVARPRVSGHLAYRVGPDFGNGGAPRRMRGRRNWR
jgi:hypothetical protein